MFTRSTHDRAQAARASQVQLQRRARACRRSQPRRSGPSDTGNKSVISNDLKIIGQGLKIISQGTLQVDGEVEGDVAGAEVIIGEQGKVTGTVAAERVIVRGKISGVIRGMTVALQASARVEGDIHHMSLAIEQGAEFDGRCRRPAGRLRAQARPGRHGQRPRQGDSPDRRCNSLRGRSGNSPLPAGGAMRGIKSIRTATRERR